MKLAWLADVLRAAGLTVVEDDGWIARGSDWPSQPVGVICHHTASKNTGPAPALGIVRDGRKDLAGPLSQFVLARDGTWIVVAAGRSNHAGRGSLGTFTAGNSSFIGVEAENDGVGEPWPDYQMDSYERGVAAILKHLGQPFTHAIGHKEWAEPHGRKTDPTFDMPHFRLDVMGFMAGRPSTPTMPKAIDPTTAMLQKGMKGASVRELQTALKKHGARLAVDGDFGDATRKAVIAFQKKNGLKEDGLVGPKTWTLLLK